MKALPILASVLTVCFLTLHGAEAGQWLGPQPGKTHVLRQADFDQLLAANPLGAGENIKVVELSRNARSANLLVQVRDREPLHRHIDSDITVFILRGEGEIRLDKETRPAKAGDVIHIERGTIHAYINRGPEPAVAVVVYSPAPGPKDRVLVEEKK